MNKNYILLSFLIFGNALFAMKLQSTVDKDDAKLFHQNKDISAYGMRENIDLTVRSEQKTLITLINNIYKTIDANQEILIADTTLEWEVDNPGDLNNDTLIPIFRKKVEREDEPESKHALHLALCFLMNQRDNRFLASMYDYYMKINLCNAYGRSS